MSKEKEIKKNHRLELLDIMSKSEALKLLAQKKAEKKSLDEDIDIIQQYLIDDREETYDLQ